MLELLTPRLKLRQISVTDWPLFVRLHQEHDIIRCDDHVTKRTGESG